VRDTPRVAGPAAPTRLSAAVLRTWRATGPDAVAKLARAARGPIVEPTADAGIFDVTFVFTNPRQAPARAGLFCPALAGGFGALTALGGGVFAGTFPLPAGTRVKYHFCPDPPPGLDAAGLFRLAHSPQARQLDYLNPHVDQVHLRGLRLRIVESLLALPGASAPLPVKLQPGVPAGTTEAFSIDSRFLRRTKNVVLYRPGTVAMPAGPLPVVLLLPGNDEWQQTGLLDNLIASGQVPPFAAVFLPEHSFTVRKREYSEASAHPRFVVDELWPRLEAAGLRCKTATVAGYSAGGLAAAWLALAEPGLFSRLAVVSAALHLTPGFDLNVVSDGSCALLGKLAQVTSVPGRCYVAVGRFEDAWEAAIYDNSVALAQLLRDRGTQVRFDTGPTGHDGVSARGYLGTGLSWLLA
jgi:enterochelin esterase-like enzyme